MRFCDVVGVEYAAFRIPAAMPPATIRPRSRRVIAISYASIYVRFPLPVNGWPPILDLARSESSLGGAHPFALEDRVRSALRL